MKRNLFARSVALGLVVSLTLSTAVFADDPFVAGEQDPIIGDSTVKNPIYDIIVPADPNFQIDPFATIETVENSQIAALDMGVMNLSDVAISFSVAATVVADATQGDPVTLMAKEDIVTDDITYLGKDAYIALVPASGNIKTKNVDNENASFNFEAGSATYSTTSAVSATIAPQVSQVDPAKLTFVLKSADYDGEDLLGLEGATGASAGATYTITVSTAFVTNDEVTINGKSYKCVDNSANAAATPKEFNAGAAAAQAGELKALIEADNENFTVAVENSVITLTEKVPGATTIPTSTSVGATGAIAVAEGTAASYATGGDNNIAAFSLYGRLNPAGAWKDGDLTVSYTFDIRGMLPDTYTKTILDEISGTQNLVGVQQAENAVALAAPKVTAAAQNASNEALKTVNVSSNRSSGYVYIILDGETASTVTALDAAVTAKKGAVGTVSAAGTNVSISTTGLVEGTYHAYAVYGSGDDAQISDKGTNEITISSTVVTAVSGQTADDDTGTVTVQSSRTGDVYIILEGVAQSTVTDLNDAVTAKNGAKAAAVSANTGVSISTTGLAAGTYYAYAVDSNGMMSKKGTSAITITTTEVTVASGQSADDEAGTVLVASNKTNGSVYIVLASEAQSTVAELETAILANKGAKATVSTTANEAVSISTVDLAAGTYNAYAVDNSGRMSAQGSNTITVTSLSTPVAVTITGSPYSKTTKGNVVFTVTNGAGRYEAASIKNIIITDRNTVPLVRDWNSSHTAHVTINGVTSVTLLGTGGLAAAPFITGTADVVITFVNNSGTEFTWEGEIVINN